MAGTGGKRGAGAPHALCPIRPGDACTLCQPGVAGPQDCGLVYLVMSDPDLREELRARRLEVAAENRSPAGGGPLNR